MQTDPSKDPIGAWSKEISPTEGWRPPMPPAAWIDYDPTSSSLPAEALPPGQRGGRRDSVAMKMMKGAEPSEIRAEAVNCANLIAREVSQSES